MNEDYAARFACLAETVNEALPRCLPEAAGAVSEAMRYSLSIGGKRVRPVLTLEFCRVCGGAPEAAMPFALALELIHTYSLIHDDLPCMDDDAMRRGKAACHIKFGEAAALLAGDALLTQAFALAAQANELPPESRCVGALLLSRAAGAAGMIGGQELDLAYEGQAVTLAQLEDMNSKKTGALLRAACLLGCLAARAATRHVAAAKRYAAALGLLFQVTDDILDVAGDSAALGKLVGSDAANNKSTWVTLLGLEGARGYAGELAARARDALIPFGPDAAFLLWMTEWLTNRKN
ncbi:MAG: polyprenyl synthetase family protein [Oscillospiraceae bacterium]|nr:polyprenyl synthetase family protein [Oscillospiraceae bacterium]